MEKDVFFDDGPPISQLQTAIKKLDEYVHEAVQSVSLNALGNSPRRQGNAFFLRGGTGQNQYHSSSLMMNDVRTKRTRPYLKAFARQDFANKLKSIHRHHVAIVGIGGIGAQVAECLTRMGIGKLMLVDKGKVKMASMGRMFYRPQECGLTKIQALRLRLGMIDQKVVIDSCPADILNDLDAMMLKRKLKASSIAHHDKEEDHGDVDDANNHHDSEERIDLFDALTFKRPYDLILCCLDDDEARLAMNKMSLELSIPLLDVTLSPCSSRLSIRSVLPGHTSCLQCILDYESTSIDHVSKSVAKLFPAVLPHCETLAAGYIAQNALKYLGEMGDFVPCFTMDLLTFQMDAYSFQPNPNCQEKKICQKQQ